MWALLQSVSLSSSWERVDERPKLSLQHSGGFFPSDLLSSEDFSGKEPNFPRLGMILYFSLVIFLTLIFK